VTLCVSYVVFLLANDLFISFTLIPTEVMITNNRVWTFFTSSFVEGDIFRLVINIVMIFMVTSPQEVKYDIFDQQFALYLGSNILVSTVGSFMWLLIRFFGSDSQSFMTEACYGSGGVIMLLVMYTRRHVGARPVLPQVPAVTFNYAPTILLAAVTLLRVLRFKSMTTDITFIYCSFFSSWTYLHFLYKVDSSDTDPNSFTFISMFPEALHPVVLPLSIAAYNFFSMIGIFPKLELDKRGMSHHLRYDTKQPIAGSVAVGDAPSAGGESTSPVATGDDIIAERRRAKAIKLLDAKMAELSKEPEGWEDLKEDGADKSKV